MKIRVSLFLILSSAFASSCNLEGDPYTCKKGDTTRREVYLRDDRAAVKVFIHARLIDSSKGADVNASEEISGTVRYLAQGYVVNLSGNWTEGEQEVTFVDGVAELKNVADIGVIYTRRDGTQCEGEGDDAFQNPCRPAELVTCVRADFAELELADGRIFDPIDLRIKEENGGVHMDATFDLAAEKDVRSTE